jgi:methionyl-tRNA formyltransferase
MKIVFFGTPDYVVPVLEALHKTYNKGREWQLIAAVTQSPKPVGRKQLIERSAVDNWAYKHKIPVAHDSNDVPEATIGVLASYGKLIPDEIINRFELGILNIHPSSLPEFRGASPIQATILSGQDHATVTVMKMDAEMDHGPIISTFKEPVHDDDTSETLRNRIFERSAQFIIDLIPSYLSGKIQPKTQNHDEATFTKMINKQDGFIPPVYIQTAMAGEQLTDEWNIRWISDYTIQPGPHAVDRFIRSMSPWPNAFSEISNGTVQKRVIIHKAHIENGKLVLDEVQLEGKNIVSGEELKKGYPDFKFG